MTAAPVLTTDRLRLRPHVMADFEPLYALFASERARFMGGPLSRREVWYWVAAETGSWALLGHGSWGIERRDDGAFLGQVGINRPDHFPEPELGWVLLETAEGQGFAHEAARCARAWFWARAADARTLVSYITPGNARSEALARRLGATIDADAALPRGETARDTRVWRHRRRQ